MLEELSLHTTPKTQAPPQRPTTLAQLNLDSELLDNYQEAKDFRDFILSNDSIPPNQVAQVMNTLTSILKEIVKMQEDLHNIERIKRMEYAIIHALKDMPDEVKQAFMDEYERT